MDIAIPIDQLYPIVKGSAAEREGSPLELSHFRTITEFTEIGAQSYTEGKYNFSL
jgi:hypothetical protein